MLGTEVPKPSMRSSNSGTGVFLVSSEPKSPSSPWEVPIGGVYSCYAFTRSPSMRSSIWGGG